MKGTFGFPTIGIGRNVIIFGVNMSSSPRIDKKEHKLRYNGANSYLFVNGTEVIKFKAKDSEIVATPLFLGNISKEFSVNNMKKTGFYGNVYDFGVDYDAIVVDDLLDIHKYLMKKHDIKLCLSLLKKCLW